MDAYTKLVVWVALIGAVIVLFTLSRRRRARYGAGTMGAVYDMLNEDKRHAIEIIVEERAEARDPENKDGNLPDLAGRSPRSTD
jgi:hypothetical protein